MAHPFLFLRRSVIGPVDDEANISPQDGKGRVAAFSHRSTFIAASPLGGKVGHPSIDASLERLYHGIEMPPDSQLDDFPPDSQLEADSPSEEFDRQWGKVGDAHTGRCAEDAHSTDMSHNVVGMDVAKAKDEPPTFPDMSGIENPVCFGFFIPSTESVHGHRGHSFTARFWWRCRFGKLTPQPGEGVAMWTNRFGETWIRHRVRDFFTGEILTFELRRSVGMQPS